MPEREWVANFFILLSIALFPGVPAVIATCWHDIRGIYVLTPKDYETTEGTVQSATVRRCGSKSRGYCFDIVYDYQVKNRNYLSGRIAYSGTQDDYEGIKFYARKYPVGARVKVYYERENPSYAALDPFNKGYPVQIAIVISLVCLIFLVVGIYTKRNQKSCS